MPDIKAKLFLLPQAPLTVIAGTPLPPDPDPVAHFQIRYGAAHFRDEADDLVTGDERKFGYLEVIIDALYVCVAQPAMGDGDPDLQLSKFGRRVGKWLQLSPLHHGGIPLDCGMRYHRDLLFPARSSGMKNKQGDIKFFHEYYTAPVNRNPAF
jgi:hypothetical protein